LKRKITLGKIDFNRTGRKINRVELELCLKTKQHGNRLVPVFTCCGSIWNSRGTDWISGGQNLDEINKFMPNNPEFQKVYRWWKLYHQNDMHAGAPRQEAEVNKYKQDHEYNYYEIVKHLTDRGLLNVPVKPDDWWRTGKPEPENGEYKYRYGSGWWYNDIPEEDLKEIEEYINDN